MLLDILIVFTLNSLSDKLLASFHLVFLENCLTLSLGTYFPVFPFWLLLCICFFLLGRLQRLWCTPKSNPACDWTWATCLELSVTHSMWLPLPGLGVCRKNKIVHQGQLLLAPGLGTHQLKPQSSQQSSSACRLSIRLISERLPTVLLRA